MCKRLLHQFIIYSAAQKENANVHAESLDGDVLRTEEAYTRCSCCGCRMLGRGYLAEQPTLLSCQRIAAANHAAA